MSSTKRLTRSSHNKMIAGVCGGIADYFGWDPTLVRIGYVLLSFAMSGFPGLIVYIIMSFVIPED